VSFGAESFGANLGDRRGDPEFFLGEFSGLESAANRSVFDSMKS